MQEFLSLIRHALTTAGGYLVAQGAITSGDAEALTGGIMALVGVAWAMWDKRRAK